MLHHLYNSYSISLQVQCFNQSSSKVANKNIFPTLVIYCTTLVVPTTIQMCYNTNNNHIHEAIYLYVPLLLQCCPTLDQTDVGASKLSKMLMVQTLHGLVYSGVYKCCKAWAASRCLYTTGLLVCGYQLDA